MTIKVFLSFQHASRNRALWLQKNLHDGGCSVVMEDDFGAGSPRTEMSEAIQHCDVVVSIITPLYPAGRATMRELDLADAYGKPVIAIFAGLSSRSEAARPFAAYRRLELEEEWADSEDQWTAILGELRGILGVERARIARGERPVLDEESALQVDHAVLLYDLEDHVVGHQLLRARPGWRRGHDEASARREAQLPWILLWTAASATAHSLVRRQFENAPPGVPVFLVSVLPSPQPPDGIVTISLERLLANTPQPRQRVPLGGDDARMQVKFLNSQVREKNQDFPLDVLNERFCCSSEVADLAHSAYLLAVEELHESEILRLQAVYNHALVLRFYGDWPTAVDIIDGELQATQGELPREADALRSRLLLEKLVLRFELGGRDDREVRDIERSVEQVQLNFRRLSDPQGYVQAGRAFGNLLRVQGNFDSAERAFQRTIGVAEYLAEGSSPGVPGQLQLADCHRELAGLYIARLDVRHARQSLADARELLDLGDAVTSPAVRYLSAVLDYVDASLALRDGVLVRATTPTEQAQAALETLSRFDNPIRVAQVYNWLGLAWASQIPRRHDDLIRGEEYLFKALRIRHDHGQIYTWGLSHLSLGELYEAKGDTDRSIDHYQQARQIFNQRGLKPALAKAHAGLARAYAQQAIGNDGPANALYREHLAQAEQRYREIQLDNEAVELHYELEHGGRHPFGEVSDDAPLIAVGEYFLHRWIREYTAARNASLDASFRLLVGVGDDAAVLSSRGIEPDKSLVYTTDSAPGSLADLTRSPEYVGRFAVIQTLADVISMGARPVGLLVNLFLSRAATVGYARRVIEAVVQEANHYGVVVLGGDMKERSEQSVGCVGIGCVDNTQILTRNAAKPGQAVGITLASSPSGGARRIGARWAQELVEHYRMNDPRILLDFPGLESVIDPHIKSDLLYVPVRVMASAVRTGYLRAAIDTSDGVLACLEILGRESDVGFELDEEAIEAVIDDRARRLAEVLDLPPALFLFSAGHDWEIVFTCEEERFAEVAESVQRDLVGNGQVVRIGRVAERRAQDAKGIGLRRLDGSASTVPYYTDEKFVPRRYQDRPAQWLRFASRIRSVGEPDATATRTPERRPARPGTNPRLPNALRIADRAPG
jgi:thiamine monophosphate kinase/tetratricopeptide (TPR) repeat protein